MAERDPLTDICDQLAAYLPQLAQITHIPDRTGITAPGKLARRPAAPLAGNAPAFFAFTGIHGAARWAEWILLYAIGASDRPSRGGSDAVTLRLLTDAIPKLAAGVDDETWRMAMAELDRTLADVLAVAALDKDEQWEPLGRRRKCPGCGTYQLYAALDSAGELTGHVQCFYGGGCPGVKAAA